MRIRKSAGFHFVEFKDANKELCIIHEKGEGLSWIAIGFEDGDQIVMDQKQAGQVAFYLDRYAKSGSIQAPKEAS